MHLSIVTTLYHSGPYLDEFYKRICRAADRITSDYEIILVNDGSPDNSVDIALGLLQQDSRIRIIDLSRNFGHHKAIMTGLMHARGDVVFLIDSDLEEDPELLEKFYNILHQSGADVVYGTPHQRKGSWFERISGTIFYALMKLLSKHPIPKKWTTMRLMNRNYVSALVQHQDQEICLDNLFVVTGFTQRSVPMHKHSKGSTTYTLRRKLSLVVQAITTSTNAPLIFIFYLGCIILSLSVIGATVLVAQWMTSGFLLGWPSVILSIWLLGGLTIFCLGIIGIYLSKVFMETKPRPYTIIRQIFENNNLCQVGSGLYPSTDQTNHCLDADVGLVSQNAPDRDQS